MGKAKRAPKPSFQITAEHLVALLRCQLAIASKDPFREFIGAVRFVVSPDHVTVEATDGHVASRLRVPTLLSTNPPAEFTVHRNALAGVLDMARRIPKRKHSAVAEPMVEVAMGKRLVRFLHGGTELYVPRYDVSADRAFPEIDRVIPARAGAEGRAYAQIVGVGAELLARVASAASHVAPWLAWTAPASHVAPILIDIARNPENGITGLFVIMPGRVAVEDYLHDE